MIFGNIKDEKAYAFLPEKIKQCFEYFKQNDLQVFAKGSHDINGKIFFVNIENYETVERSARFWEGHRQYIDVHMMIEGCETIDVNFTGNMQVESYDEERDFVAMQGEAKASVNLTKNGDFLICYPEDAHRTAIICGESNKLKKAIFKVKL